MSFEKMMIKKLKERTGMDTPEKAAIALAQDLFSSVRPIDPPYDLFEFTSPRGIIEVKEVQTGPDGCIYSLNGTEFVVELRKNQVYQRKRFTLAHEIGHTFFFELLEKNELKHRRVDKNIEKQSKLEREEFLCNVIAAELLMPRKVLFQMLHEDHGASIKSILNLSKIFGTSVRSTAIQFVKAAGEIDAFKALLVVWKLIDVQNPKKGFKPLWQSRYRKTRADLPYTMRTTHDTQVFQAFNTNEIIRGRQWLTLGRTEDNYYYITEEGYYYMESLRIGSKKNGEVMSIIIFDKRGETAEHLAARSAVITKPLGMSSTNVKTNDANGNERGPKQLDLFTDMRNLGDHSDNL